MTVEQLRKSEEYFKAIDKIRKYPKGFRFTLYYSSIPRARANALEILMHDCIKMGLVESVSIGIALPGIKADETFRRLQENLEGDEK